MGMMLRRYHAAKQEKYDKQEAIEEAKATVVYEVQKENTTVGMNSDLQQVIEKRKYTKRTES
jgi:hypothetical protein